MASCCILLVLNDETMDSAWCRHEVECARDHSIPILCIIDTDRIILRTTVNELIEKGYGFLFDQQVILSYHIYMQRASHVSSHFSSSHITSSRITSSPLTYHLFMHHLSHITSSHITSSHIMSLHISKGHFLLDSITRARI
jgi:hypothetical protein